MVPRYLDEGWGKILTVGVCDIENERRLKRVGE